MFPQTLQQPVRYLGDVTNVTGNVETYLVQQMHAIATAIYQAKQRNDKATVATLLERFKDLAEQYRAQGAGDMSATDHYIVAVGNWIQGTVSAIPDAVAALPAAVGQGLIKAALPFALLFIGYLYVTSGKNPFRSRR